MLIVKISTPCQSSVVQVKPKASCQIQVYSTITTVVKFPIVSEVVLTSDKIGRGDTGNGVRALSEFGPKSFPAASSTVLNFISSQKIGRDNIVQSVVKSSFSTLSSPMLSSLSRLESCKLPTK